MNPKLTPQEAMSLAIEEARKGIGFVSPNPLVGCTILDKDGHLLAVGYHRALGQDHAEIDALNKVQDKTKLKGAHVYVTLEPCAHQGRTPSCARHLATLPLASVTYGLKDPNPLVSGKGATLLQEAGIATQEFSGLHEELEELAEVFLHNQRAQKPFVALKVATSLDGQMGLATGASKWLTSEQTRTFSHSLRAAYDAVVIGRNTFVKDAPSLNVRHPGFPGHTNKVVLIDPLGRTLEALSGSNLLSVRPPENLFVVVRQGTPVRNAPAGVQILQAPSNEDGAILIPDLLQCLWDKGLRSLYVEGGAHTFGHFLATQSAQRLHLFMAPCLVGGMNGHSWTKFFGIDQLADRLSIREFKARSIGPDIYVTGRL